MQKKAIRAATHSQYNAHTAPLLAELGILPYKDMITYAQLTFMHSIHYGYAPAILRGLWHRNADRHIEHNLRNAQEYIIPRANYAFYTKTPAYALAKAWNTAPTARYHHNPTTFRISIKNELIGQYITPPAELEHLDTLANLLETPTQMQTQTQAQAQAHTPAIAQTHAQATQAPTAPQH